MARIEKRAQFQLEGTTYECAAQQPELAAGSVRRFTSGEEPKVIAQVPLAGGGKVEVHGYATHYNREWVTVVWNDENFQQIDCWAPAADVRRPGEAEWAGKYVQF